MGLSRVPIRSASRGVMSKTSTPSTLPRSSKRSIPVACCSLHGCQHWVHCWFGGGCPGPSESQNGRLLFLRAIGWSDQQHLHLLQHGRW